MIPLTDKFGNQIQVIQRNRKRLIYLHLLNENHRRRIGEISGATMTVQRIKSKHLFRKFNAVGFNHYILSNTELARTIRLIFTDTGDVFRIPIEYVLKNGKFLNFQKQGFELQIFVTLDEIEQFRRKS